MNEATPSWGSDQDFQIASESGTEVMRVTVHPSTSVANRVAGRTVVASNGVFRDDGAVLSPLGGGSGVDISAIGTFVNSVPFSGEPGFVDPTSTPVDAGGWIAMLASSGDITVGNGNDASARFVDIGAGNVTADVLVSCGPSHAYLWAEVDNCHLRFSASSVFPAMDPGYGAIFVRATVAGKMQLCAKFPTGAVQVIATEV